MTNSKTNASPMHLSPKIGGSHSRTPSTDSSGKKRSKLLGLLEKLGVSRPKSPISPAVIAAPTASLASTSAQSTPHASSSATNVSISTSNASNHALIAITSNLRTISLSSPSNGTKVTSVGSARNATNEVLLNLRSDIFPKNNVAKVNIDVLSPKIGNDIKDTAQLVLYLSLLSKRVSSASASFLSSSSALSNINNPVFSKLSDSQQAWILEMEKHPCEKQHLEQLTIRMSNQFISRFSEDTEAIREIVLIGSVMNGRHYKKLFECFLHNFDRAILLDADVLMGMIQLIQGAPSKYLTQYDLNLILRCLRRRLEDSALQDKDVLALLVLASAMVLVLMVACQTKDLHREGDYEPLLKKLIELSKDEDPLVMYQANYACQSLLLVPNNETRRQEFRRHFFGLSGGLLRLSGVIRLEFDGIVEGLPEVIKGARGLFGLLKKELGSGGEAHWFTALRKAEDYVDQGNLKDLNSLICEPRHRQDPLFLWGVCQLLGEIAADPTWDLSSREKAVEFLGEIYSVNLGSEQDQDIRRWVLTILDHISELSTPFSSATFNFMSTTSNSAITTKARDLTLDLKQSGVFEFEYSHPLRIGLPLPRSCLLLKEVNDNPDLDHNLYKLRHLRLSECNKQTIYVEPLSKPSLLVSDMNALPLMDKVKQFLGSDLHVFLILGDSGAGKSSFNSHLEHVLWDEYNPRDPIPLFVNLPAIDRPDQDLIRKQLRMHELFSDLQIEEMKRDRQFLLICDGYDEAQLDLNLYTTNRLNQKGPPYTKIIISCRSSFIGEVYRYKFQPKRTDRYRTTDLFAEAAITPFSVHQIEDYVRQFVRDTEVHKLMGDRTIWDFDEYMVRLSSIPNMMELVENPFLLAISLRVLPLMVGEAVDLSKVKVTRLMLYNSFVGDWLAWETDRLKSSLASGNFSGDAKKALEELLAEAGYFEARAVEFLKELADFIFREQDGIPVVEYKPNSDQKTWKAKFFSLEPEVTLLRGSSPLSCAGHQYRFIHPSLLEYFYSRYIYDSSKPGDKAPKDSPDLDFTNHPLSKRNLVRTPSVIQFLAEHVQGDSAFEKRLRQIIEQSKTDDHASQAAANAITILVRAGIRFSGADLNGVRISGADLSFGIFDSAQLQGADLRKTCLQGAWLRDANLTDALMDESFFGEWPALSDEKMQGVFAYSPDGGTFLASTEGGSIQLYNTSTWLPFAPLEGHSVVGHLKFSPDKSISVAAASGDHFSDNTVRLWDVAASRCLVTMEGHKGTITGLAFSLCGQQLALCFRHGEVQLWDVHASKPELTFCVPDEWKDLDYDNQHGCDEYIQSFETIGWRTASGLSNVEYSPDGNVLATCFLHQSLRLWSLETGNCLFTLKEPKQAVNGMAFTRDGKQILSSGFEGGVVAWDTTTGARLWKWEPGVKTRIWSMSLSPTGQQVACAGEHGMASLLDPASEFISHHNLKGHVGNVYDIAYSVDGLRIATAGEDRTVRLWDAKRGTPGPIFRGHSQAVERILFSPNGLQIASESRDRTIRLWDASAPAVHIQQHQSSSRHVTGVQKVFCLPGGQYIASLSTDSACLWDRQTGWLHRVIEAEEFCHFKDMYTSPCGNEVAIVVDVDTYYIDYVLQLWDVQTGLHNYVFKTSLRTSPKENAVYYLEDGVRIACLVPLGVDICNRRTGKLEARLSTSKDSVDSISLLISPNKSRQLVMTDSEGVISLWDMGTYKLQHRIEVPLPPTIVVYSPDGTALWVYSQGGSMIQSWDAVTGVCTKTVRIGSTIHRVFSCNGSRLVAYAQLEGRSRVVVRDAITGDLLCILDDATEGMILQLSPDNQMLATCARESIVRVWDISRGNQIAEITNSEGETAVTTLCWCKMTSSTPTPSTATQAEGRQVGRLQLVIGHAEGDVSVWKLMPTEYGSSPSYTRELFIKKTQAVAMVGQEITSKGGLTGKVNQYKKQMPRKDWNGEEEIAYRLDLQWTTASGKLNAHGTTIQNVKGLSTANARLLTQNGAKGEPTKPFGF